MELFGRDLQTEVAVVAEIGVNHEGDPAVASSLMQAVATAGADAVKLQSYTPARFISSSDPERLARVARFALDRAAHERLFREASHLGIRLFSTPVTEDWLDFLAERCEAIKIASGDLTFETLVRAAARTHRKLILSTGCADESEVATTLSWVAEETGSALREQVIVLQCTAAYPTPIEEANLLSIPYLAERFGVTVGYSNHVVGSEAPLAAVALGARVVEVHVTDCRQGRRFRDHALSFEPPELADLVARLRRVRLALGRPGKFVQASEAPGRLAIRKGIVAARQLAAGQVLTESDLMYARPASEFRAAERNSLIGCRLLEPLAAGQIISRDAVTPAKGSS